MPSFQKKSLLRPTFNLRKFVSGWLVPPRFAKVFDRVGRSFSLAIGTRHPSDPLAEFMGEDWVFLRAALSEANDYLEYGAGLSTEFVARDSSCTIRSIETSSDWFAMLSAKLNGRAEILHVDLGRTGDWGRPLSYECRGRFLEYFEAGFREGYRPNLILIDGRFRVACFLTCVALADPGTKIIFDDYFSRGCYHVVEEILAPVSVNLRQALFERPGHVDTDQIIALRDQFAFVMD